jgi:hypothetical protein
MINIEELFKTLNEPSDESLKLMEDIQSYIMRHHKDEILNAKDMMLKVYAPDILHVSAAASSFATTVLCDQIIKLTKELEALKAK